MSTEIEDAPTDLAATITERLEADKNTEAEQPSSEPAQDQEQPTEPVAEETSDNLSIPPEPPEEPEPSEPAPSGVLDRMKGEGIDLTHKFKSEDDLARAYVELESRLGQRDEDAAAWREFAKDPQRYLAHFMPEQPAAEEPVAESKGDVPEWNPDWLTQVHEVDGKLEPLPGAEPGVVDKLVRAQRYAQKQQYENIFNPQKPQEIDPSRIEELVEQRVQEQLGNYTSVMQTAQAAQNIVERNAKWIFEDPENPNVQDRTLTRRGRAYQQHLSNLPEHLVTSSPSDQHQWALDQMELAAARANRSARPAQPQTRSSAEPAIDDGGVKYDDGKSLADNIIHKIMAAGLKPR